MRRWKQRIISLLLVVSMVFGLTQGNTLQAEAAVLSETNLNAADGIIWLTTNEDGTSVSDEFTTMVVSMKLADLVCNALGEEEGTAVYYDDINIRNAMALLVNKDTLINTLKTAITDHKLVTFKIGENKAEKSIAFRNLKSDSLKITDGEDNVIYIDHMGAPANVSTLESMITNALNSTEVYVEHYGAVNVGAGSLMDKTGANKVGLVGGNFVRANGVSYSTLLKNWPTADSSPDSRERLAGQVTVTIYAAEYSYSQDMDKFAVTKTFDVIMRDQRVSVNAAVKVNGEYVQDEHLKSLTKEYSSEAVPSKGPVSDYYNFVGYEANVMSGYAYTAVMEAKVDRNGNGLHDAFEGELTVKYFKEYDDTDAYYEETVAVGGIPKGPSTNPTKESYKFTGWITKDNVEWPVRITSDISFYAVWKEVSDSEGSGESGDSGESGSEEETEYTATATLIFDGVEALTQSLTVDSSKQKITVPGWETAFAEEKYEFVGWYYEISDSDGTSKKVEFDASSYWYPEGVTELELYCEFLSKIEAYNPNTNDKEYVDQDTKLIYYTIQYDDGTTEELMPSLERYNVEEALEDPVYNKNLAKFDGWDTTEVDENIYTVTPYYEVKYNNKFAAESEEITFECNDEGALYTIGNDYKSQLSISSSDGENYVGTVVSSGEPTHTYVVSENTIAEIEFPYDENGNIGYYITGIKAVYGGEKIDIPVTYENYNATATGIYSAIDNEINGGASTVDDGLKTFNNVTLIPQYQEWDFSGKTSIELTAGKDSYVENEIYNKVFEYTNAPAYNDDYVTVQYKAKADSYYVSLNKLIEYMGADALKEQIEAYDIDIDEYKITSPNEESQWLDVESSPGVEKTAQEAVDAYLKEEYENYKNSDMGIDEFLGNVLVNLTTTVYENTVHKLGYSDPTNPIDAESLRIIYDSPMIGNVDSPLYVTATLEDGRAVPTITAVDVTCTYGDDIHSDITAKIMAGISATVTDKDTNETSSVNINTALCVTYDADTNTVRDFSDIGVGTYKVMVVFRGDDNLQPEKSNTITLTVEQAKATVTVPDIVTMEGKMYAQNVSATVTPATAPIVQVIAGIAMDEMTFGVNTEGSVEDWNLELSGGTVTIKAWVKMPQTYIEMLDSLGVEGLEVGTFKSIEEYEAALKYNVSDTLRKQIEGILNQIPNIVREKFGINDLEYDIQIRLDSLEDDVYPTDAGFYVNYAATLSSFNDFNDSGVEIDKNHSESDDYGFIVVSPMVTLPNRGGVQLYDSSVENAQNVFVYEYDANDVVERDLSLSLNSEAKDWEPFYYGLTTRFNATKEAPRTPGVYFAGYNYTVTENDEVKLLGSDCAIIIIKQQEVNLTITGGTYKYDGENHFAEVKITDNNGKEINDSGVTVISGTVNANVDSTNVSADDLYGAVNVDFPDALQSKLDEYCKNVLKRETPNEISPGDLITFLKKCGEEATAAANNAMEDFKSLAMKDAVSSILDQINVSSDAVVSGTEKAQTLLQGGKAYYDKLIKQLEPLTSLDNNVYMTFYDLDEESSKLDYAKTGYYLYMGVTTDPDMTVDTGKGLVIISSDKEYIMHDTTVPYNGKEQTIYKEDGTKRGDVTVMVNSEENEVSFFLDGDVYKAMNEVLAAIEGVTVKVQDGSDATVSTIYEGAEGYAEDVYDKLFYLIEQKVIAKLNLQYEGSALDSALATAHDKLKELTGRLSNKLQAVDKLDGATTIILYNMENADDLQGMPIDVGTYNFYGYDYDVSATRGTLVIKPVCIEVDDNGGKTYGDADPEAWECIEENIRYYYEDADGNQIETELPEGVEFDDLISYETTIGRNDGEENAGTYEMWINGLALKDTTGNYELVDLTNNEELDFVIEAKQVSLTAEATPAQIVVNGSTEINVIFNDVDGNELENITTDDWGYTISGTDGSVALEDACKTEGAYVITPELKNTNYVVMENGINQGRLIVTSSLIPLLQSTVTVTPSSVLVNTLTAKDVTFSVAFEDNLGTDAEKLKLDYFSDEYQILLNGTPVELDYALANVGTYDVVALNKGNIAGTYPNYIAKNGKLRVISEEEAGNYISIRVATDNSSFVSGTVVDVEDYINPQLKVVVNGVTITAEDALWTLLSPTYTLYDSNGNKVDDINSIANKVGTYTFEVSYSEEIKEDEEYADYTVYKYPTIFTVEPKTLTVNAGVYRNGSYVTKVAVNNTVASEYKFVIDASANVNGVDPYKYIEGYEIKNTEGDTIITVSYGSELTDAHNTALQKALDEVGTLTVTPILKAGYENEYEKVYVYSATLQISLKEVYVYPVIYYNETGNLYTYDRIGLGHDAKLITGYVVEPAAFWEADCNSEEKDKLKQGISGYVTWTNREEFEEVSDILNTAGLYIFEMAGNSTVLDPNEYLVKWGTRELTVTELGAKAKIRPKDETIFTTVTDGEYTMYTGNEPSDILQNLNFSLTGDDGEDLSELIIGITVTGEGETTETAAIATMSLEEESTVTYDVPANFDTTSALTALETLATPGTYTITMVLDKDAEITSQYANIEPDSIVVQVVKEGSEYVIGMRPSFRVNEPWALKAFGSVYPKINGEKSDEKLTKTQMEELDFGIYFLRASDTEKTIDELTYIDFTNGNSKAILYSKNDVKRPVVIEEDGTIVAEFDEGIYADQLSESIYTLYYVVDGEKVSYSSIKERNPHAIVAAETATTSGNDKETIAVCNALLEFEEVFLEYIGEDKGIRAEKQHAPTLEEYTLPKTNYKEYNVDPPNGRYFSYTNKITIVEPWTIKFDAYINNDTNVYEEYGFVVYYDKESKYQGNDITVEQLLSEYSAYVFSSKNGDASKTIDANGRTQLTAIYNKDIYTYQINNAAYVMFYVYDGSDYYYGPVKKRVIYDILNNSKTNNTEDMVNSVIDKMINMYKSVADYHNAKN